MTKPLFPPPPSPPAGAQSPSGGANFPAPAGIPNLHELVGEEQHPVEQGTLIDASDPVPGQFSLDDERVICRGCRHSWIFKTMFEAQNPHPDGRPWLKSEGYCLAAPVAVISLQQRAVYECNRFEKKGEASE